MAAKRKCACGKTQTRSRRVTGKSADMYEKFTGSSAKPRRKAVREKDVDDSIDDQIKIIPKLALAGATTGMIMGLGTGMAGMFSNMGGN